MPFVANSQTSTHHRSRPRGEICQFDGQDWYCIRDYDGISPFLMNVVSDTDLWMYLSSAGSLTAGRVTADNCLFPYETADRLHLAHLTTGPVTLIRCDNDPTVWQPFADHEVLDQDVSRSISKNVTGNRVRFDEHHQRLDLKFSYDWAATDRFGFVRTARLTNQGPVARTIHLLDGFRNVMPWGVPLSMSQSASCLVDAYRRAEYDRATRLAVLRLTARISDDMYPAEALRCNVVWSCGLPSPANVSLDAGALNLFRRCQLVQTITERNGQKASYLVATGPLTLEPGGELTWFIVGDVGRDHLQVAELRDLLRRDVDLRGDIESAIADSTAQLTKLVARVDGVQSTSDQESTHHHFANALFNGMRGGIIWSENAIPRQSFIDFLCRFNSHTALRHQEALKALPGTVSHQDLYRCAESTGDANLLRLVREFLPITFSRRHGDPSRPWNQFTLRIKGPDGGKLLHYEGNWRDIFQNWEALSVSFPGYLENLIAKFVNGSTVDGYNPYRVTSEGLEWEVPEPDDPWGNIGYWGDHQIVYLLKFLESLQRVGPDRLATLLPKAQFTYFQIPYRLRPYRDLRRDPRATIDFDTELAAAVERRVTEVGQDGKLLPDQEGGIYYVTLWEKLLVPVMSKLSNFVIGGGIWMNTQRPEWNDANNALVGNGLSLVTLCYLRRYLVFLKDLLTQHAETTLTLSTEIVGWIRDLHRELKLFAGVLSEAACDDLTRGELMDALGSAFSKYREQVYQHGFSGKTQISSADLAEMCGLAMSYADHTIRANRRSDELFHAYNLLEWGTDGARLRRLYEMLEGQVAVLSSGVLTPAEAVDLLQALFVSRLYRADQNSFLLYPYRDLPDFVDTNVVPDERVDDNPLLRALTAQADTSIIAQDTFGTFRFHGDLSQSHDVSRALSRLAAQGDDWQELVGDHGAAVVELFEQVFAHQEYTGRSGVMYGFEGLGCIYWHMVSKLLLAVQEYFFQAVDSGASADTVDQLAQLYYRVRGGLGFEKSPAEYGAFPTDPYSHTPQHSGAQQPGMTGQVKEDVLTRFGELGVRVEDGCLRFEPRLLRRGEFFPHPSRFEYYDLGGDLRWIEMPADSLAFTYCQVPVVYRLADERPAIQVQHADGREACFDGEALDAEISKAILLRSGDIVEVRVSVAPRQLA